MLFEILKNLRWIIVTRIGLNRAGVRRLEFYEEIISRFLAHKDTLLDVGCGSCEVSRRLKSPSFKVGLDINFRSLIKAKNNEHNKRAYHLELICADAHFLPFREQSFSSIILISLLEHLKSPQDVIRECYRVLRSRGRIILQIPNLQKLFEPHTWIPMILLPNFVKKVILQKLRHDFINFNVTIQHCLKWLHSSGFVKISYTKIWWGFRIIKILNWPIGWIITAEKGEFQRDE